MFYDSIESHIWGLSSLGKSEHSYGDQLVLTIMGKLPTEIKRNLTRHHSNAQWILSHLMAAILKEIRILESGLCDPHNPMPRSTAATLHVNSQDRPNKKPNQDNPDGKRKQCVFCKGSHTALNCEICETFPKANCMVLYTLTGQSS